MREYELLMVLQPGLDDEGVTSVIGNVEERLQKDGGEMVASGQLTDRKGSVAEVTEGWKTRRLAYPIDKHREGYYVVLRLQTPPASIDEMERGLRLDENVLRYMTIREEE
jgi:small subunit ribosomal protein S6